MYTFGSDYWGCIGCNNELDEEVTTPYRVEFFAENPVSQVACGECHIVALTGDVFLLGVLCSSLHRGDRDVTPLKLYCLILMIELPQTTNISYPQANQCEYEQLSIW